MTLPEPACPLGYTTQQVQEILGPRFRLFERWFNGRTASVCEGREWNHRLHRYEPTACAGHPHGFVVFREDIEQFLRRFEDGTAASAVGVGDAPRADRGAAVPLKKGGRP